MNDRIEKQIELKAPLPRVWQALTNYQEFGEWFRVKLDSPFQPGQKSRGNILYPGYEYIVVEIAVQELVPQRFFSYTWHPYPADPAVDYSQEPPTLVEFRLEEIPGGTLLRVTESGFDKIPAHRRDEAFRMNEGGWTEQLQNIEAYVEPKR